MNPKIEKYILILFILMFGLLNIGIIITAITLLLDFDKLVKEQLIEIIAIILFTVFFNFGLLALYKDERRE